MRFAHRMRHHDAAADGVDACAAIASARDQMPRRALVIGAGCSGLVAIKELREEGIDVVCLEAQSWVGGLWRFTENESHSSVYRYGSARLRPVGTQPCQQAARARAFGAVRHAAPR